MTTITIPLSLTITIDEANVQVALTQNNAVLAESGDVVETESQQPIEKDA